MFEWNVTSYATEWYVPVQDLVEIYEVSHSRKKHIIYPSISRFTMEATVR